MQALQTAIPFLAITSAVTTAVDGTPFAVPLQYMGPIAYMAVPTGSVSAFSYNLKGSIDGITFATLAAAMTTQAALSAAGTLRAPIMRLDQVSRADGTSQALYATLTKV